MGKVYYNPNNKRWITEETVQIELDNKGITDKELREKIGMQIVVDFLSDIEFD